MELADLLSQLEVAKEQNRVLGERIHALMKENEGLRRRMDELCRRFFGRKAEHVNPAQLALAFAQLDAEAAASTPSLAPAEPASQSKPEPGDPVPQATPRPGHGRNRPPAHLRRRRVAHEPTPKDCVCSGCQKPMKRIGEEVSEQYDYVPACFEVIEHVRGKYACSTCKEGVLIAPVPDKLIEKGLATEGLIAQVAVSKFGDHVPLARQTQIYAREGVHLDAAGACESRRRPAGTRGGGDQGGGARLQGDRRGRDSGGGQEQVLGHEDGVLLALPWPGTRGVLRLHPEPGRGGALEDAGGFCWLPPS